jgi:RNA polymerase sigma-70 factor (ECF subfamily)
MTNVLVPDASTCAPCLDDGGSRSTKPWSEWEDLELVEAASAERLDAWAELYRRHAGSVAATARAVLGQSPECDDIVVEVFAKLWHAPGKFDATRGTLLGYLRVVARSRSLDWLRAEASRQRREE